MSAAPASGSPDPANSASPVNSVSPASPVRSVDSAGSASPAGPTSTASLAAERTRLAWRRTTLTGVAFVLITSSHMMLAGPSPGALAAISLMCLAWLASVAVAYRRIRELSVAPSPTPSASPARQVPAAAPAHTGLLVVAFAAIGALLLVR